MNTTDFDLETTLKHLKNLEKKIKKPVNIKTEFKHENIQKLKKALDNASKWSLKILEFENEIGTIHSLPYVSKFAKSLMECFYTFEAKHPYEGLKEGLKLNKVTHHSFCNVPVVAGPVNRTEDRTDKIIFYPSCKLETEKEYSFVKINRKKNKVSITLAKVYYDIALKKLLMYKIEKFEIDENIVNIPENVNDLDLRTIKSQVIAISKEEIKNKVPLRNRKAVYKEFSPVDDYQILSECSIKKTKNRFTAELVNEEGEILEFRTLYSSRPVAFTVFGIGFEKSLGWFPCALIINVFKRKDILSKKLSTEEYMERHSYHLNGKKIQVNYKNLYLKGIYGIDKIPYLWSYASISTNNNKLNLTIPVPIQKKGEDKWQKVKPSSIAKAVYQILKTEKINYKGEEIYLPGKRMYIEKEFIDIKEPNWLNDALELVRVSVEKYRIFQSIKRGLDFLEDNMEDIGQLIDFIGVKILKENQ